MLSGAGCARALLRWNVSFLAGEWLAFRFQVRGRRLGCDCFEFIAGVIFRGLHLRGLIGWLTDRALDRLL